jgi:hypothetical protein
MVPAIPVLFGSRQREPRTGLALIPIAVSGLISAILRMVF